MHHINFKCIKTCNLKIPTRSICRGLKQVQSIKDNFEIFFEDDTHFCMHFVCHYDYEI